MLFIWLLAAIVAIAAQVLDAIRPDYDATPMVSGMAMVGAAYLVGLMMSSGKREDVDPIQESMRRYEEQVRRATFGPEK